MERKLFYKTRAIKIGYVIDRNTALDDVKAIMLANFNFIGGRYNQFFLLENNDFSNEDYDRLQEFDADFYITLSDVSDELKDIIITRFSPLEILDKNQIRIIDGKLEFHGTILNKSPVSLYVSRNGMIDSNKINYINFIVANGIENNIQELLQFNFGFPFDTNNRFQGFPIKDIHINNREDLFDYFNHYQGEKFFFKNILSQISYQQFGSYKPEDMSICLIVGNSLDDYLYFWNRNIINSSKESIFLNTFILPIESLEGNIELINGMIKFIQIYTSTRSPYKVSLHSCKFTKDELSSLNLYTRLYELNLYDEIIYKTDWYTNIRGWNAHVLYECENITHLDMGLGTNIIPMDEGFMIDSFLEYDKGGNREHMLGINGAFLLCNRNNKAYTGIFSRKINSIGPSQPLPLRINKARSISYFEDTRRGMEDLHILVPNAENIIFNTIKCSIGTQDGLNNFDNVEYSDQGKKTAIVFGLFNHNIPQMSKIIEDEKWKNIFEKYNQVIKKDEVTSEIIDILTANPTLETNKLSEKIFKRMEKHFIKYRELYISFIQILKEYGIEESLINKYRLDTNIRGNNFTEEERTIIKNLKGTVEYLISNSILLQGIRFDCPYCKEKYWISIKETLDKNRCRGCGNLVNLPIEENWSYAFNTMLKGSEVKGIFAVLNYLENLVIKTHYSSFLYGLGIECKELINGVMTPITDGDIVALIQGYLFLCEIKNSRDSLHESDFLRIEKIAMKIRPDNIVFSANGIPSTEKEQQIKNWKNNLQEKLKKFNIQVLIEKIDTENTEMKIINPYLPT